MEQFTKEQFAELRKLFIPKDDVGVVNKRIQTLIRDARKEITIPVTAMSPTTSSGCADIAKVEAATNDVDFWMLDFDASSAENCFFFYTMPDNWNGKGFKARFVWTAASGSGTVVWALKSRAYKDDDAIDQAYGTEKTVEDDLITANDIHITPETDIITPSGTPAGGQMLQFKVTRKAADAADDFSADARLIAVKIKYFIGDYNA